MTPRSTAPRRVPAVPSALLRRRLLAAAGLSLIAGYAGTAFADGPGPLRPRLAAPAVRLLRHDGKALPLADQLGGGGLTAVQLMFTGCSAVCPMQGALFAALQARLAAESVGDVRLLSLSIDPLGDGSAALAGWLRRHGAGPRWSAAAPAVADLDRLLGFLGRRGQTLGDSHTTEVSLFDAQGRLAWRTSGLPPIEEISRALQGLRG